VSEPFPLGHMDDPFGELNETCESTTKTGDPMESNTPETAVRPVLAPNRWELS
jgi:hypothetical protein